MTGNEDFQARATDEGRAAQEVARRVLVGCGFRIQEPANQVHKDLGVTINYVCADSQGASWCFDVVGSFTSRRSGLLRTDSVWKALGRASVLTIGGVSPVILLTTNLPGEGTVGDRALRASGGHTFFDAIEMTTVGGKARLRHYAAGGVRRPLPGFWTAPQLYGHSLRPGGPGGASLRVPVARTGDPFRRIIPEYQVTDMPYRLQIFLPSQTRKGNAVVVERRRAAALEIKRLLSGLGGGCTSQDATGSWIDPIRGTIDEEVLVVESYSRRPFPDRTVALIVRIILEELDQESAALVLGGEMLQFTR